MKKFIKLNEYTDDDLIIIVFIDSEHWQKAAVEYAKQLLIDREITNDYAKSRIKEIEKESIELWNRELEERKVESFGIIELILMPLFWFKYILKDWYLAKEGYYRMRKQRLLGIGIGLIFYSFIIAEASYTSKEREQEKTNEITQLNISDSIAFAKIDWSGTYVFVDSSLQKDNKLVWTLIIQKKELQHNATLSILNNNQTDIIKGQGVIKNEEFEFYPDSTYQLLSGKKISYYDRLISLIKKNESLLTYWGKLEPFSNKNYNELGNYFKKTTAANKKYSASRGL